jgi:hypothetical protein
MPEFGGLSNSMISQVEWKYWRMEYWSVVPVKSSLRYPITACHFLFGSSRIGALD